MTHPDRDLAPDPGAALAALYALPWQQQATLGLRWRWFANLHISERQTASGGTEFCWRTPVGEGCIEHDFASPKVGLIPTDGATIVLAQPAIVPIVPAPERPERSEVRTLPEPDKGGGHALGRHHRHSGAHVRRRVRTRLGQHPDARRRDRLRRSLGVTLSPTTRRAVLPITA